MAKVFQVGLKVRVADAGYVYAFCDPAAQEFGLKNYMPGAGLNVEDNATGKVAHAGRFFSEAGTVLIGVTLDDGTDIVIDEQGLEA